MASDRTAVLILGGYGTFGGRLVRLLAGETRHSFTGPIVRYRGWLVPQS